MVFLPCIYTSHTYYLVKHPIDLDPITTAVLFGCGVICILANYDADRQRQHFRATDGKCTVWGKPPKVVKAKYITGDGREQTSLLLASGWWGLSRHWHYIPEILASVFWSQCLVTGSLMSWFYAIYLTLLLTDRAWRDDERCRGKYGKYWAEYCTLVPYKIIPGII
jgi:7-dehydrocholesterol reductase